MTDARVAAVIVLAAGEGTRMKSTRTPKVLHELGGRSMLGHVVAAARALQPEHLLVVVGHERDRVSAHLAEIDSEATAVVQQTQDGTGHAVRVALERLGGVTGTVVVVPGDAPLLTAATLGQLVSTHDLRHASTTLLTAQVVDATGYGRVVRSGGAVNAVVEHRDADEAVRQIKEIATSVYAFDIEHLRESLTQLTTDNAQGEQYLTDVVALQHGAGRTVAGHPAPDADETLGINDRTQLVTLRRLLRDRIVREHGLAGVTVVDPATTWIDVDVRLEADVTVHPGTQLHGRTSAAAGAVLGPDSTLIDCEVGEDAAVLKAHCVGAVIGPAASVGPYTYLRPGTRLEKGSKAGGFVEIKASRIGVGSKVPHLSYVGDAVVGERSNIGAATVVVNYDGRAKHRTIIGDDVRIGSDTMLVAPVQIGDGAYTAAGSVITDDVPAGALGVGRARQRNIQGWVARKRPGDTSDAASGQQGEQP